MRELPRYIIAHCFKLEILEIQKNLKLSKFIRQEDLMRFIFQVLSATCISIKSLFGYLFHSISNRRYQFQTLPNFLPSLDSLNGLNRG